MFRGRKLKFIYKVQKLILLDETYARKLFEMENPGVDFKEAKKAEEGFLRLKLILTML